MDERECENCGCIFISELGDDDGAEFCEGCHRYANLDTLANQQTLIDELVVMLKQIDRDGERTGKYCTCIVCADSFKELITKATKG
jgi:hypothetical protein